MGVMMQGEMICSKFILSWILVKLLSFPTVQAHGCFVCVHK